MFSAKKVSLHGSFQHFQVLSFLRRSVRRKYPPTFAIQELLRVICYRKKVCSANSLSMRANAAAVILRGLVLLGSI